MNCFSFFSLADLFIIYLFIYLFICLFIHFLADLWDTEEAGVDSLLGKHVANDEDKIPVPGKGDLAKAGEKELVKEAADEIKKESSEAASQPSAAEKQEKLVTTSDANRGQDSSEKLNEGERVEVKRKQESLQEVPKLEAQKTETILKPQLNNPEKSNAQHQEPSLTESSKILTKDVPSGKTSDQDELQMASHKRDNSNGSVDSSWSKLSEEELKVNSEKEGTKLSILLTIVSVKEKRVH